MSDIDTLIDRLSDRQRREFSLWCAERVRRLMIDPRSTNALDVAARHLRGEATDEELAAARTKAWNAAAAQAAAQAAALAALWTAARDTALGSAGAAALAAALDLSVDAGTFCALGLHAERAAQRVELERILKEPQP
jgi:hypothetical protein